MLGANFFYILLAWLWIATFSMDHVVVVRVAHDAVVMFQLLNRLENLNMCTFLSGMATDNEWYGPFMSIEHMDSGHTHTMDILFFRPEYVSF